MGLQSQATRAGESRRYSSSSSGRKARKAPWVALFAVAVALIGGYIYFYAGSTPTAGNNAPPPGEGGQPAAAPTDNDDNRAASTAGQGTPTRGERTTPARPPVNYDTPRDDQPARPLTGAAREQYEQGMALIEQGQAVAGRALLSELLFRDAGSLPRHEAQAIRERLTHVNETLVFSRTVVEGDPIAVKHTVQRGEYLERDISPAFKVPHQFLMRINGIQDARRLNAGVDIKCIRGPIHARVVKHEYRMDLFIEDPDGLRIYLCSFPVGLGEFDSTPAGLWRIKPGSKVTDPDWRNPRTGEYFDRDDPNIPIGEYWMALEGMDDNTRDAEGYGIHGTNQEASIGRQESMGCVRMQSADIEQVFHMLSGGDSYVEILP